MNGDQIIRTLLTSASRAAEDRAGAEARAAKRLLWARAAIAVCRDLQEEIDEAWDKMLAERPDDARKDELLPDPPQQRHLDYIHALMDDVIERDRWPREMYWHAI